MKEYYGLVRENAIRLNCVSASLVLMENLITKDGYHILFHRPETVLSPTLKFDNGNERILDVYELFTGDGKKHNLYIDIYNDENLWIPPTGFMFEFDLLYYEDDGDEIEVKIEQQYIFDCEQIGLDIFDFYERNHQHEIEKILDGSWGVNYKVNNFPEQLIEIYKNRNSR
jgi:hypothetical protein